MITELYEKAPFEQDILNNITLNLKIKTENKLAPLKISFQPIDKHGNVLGPAGHVFTLYGSDTNKEPSDQSNTVSLLNPERFMMASTMTDPKTSRQTFAAPYFYLTVLPSNDFRIRVTATFKPEPKRKKLVNMDPNDELFVAEMKKMQEIANLEGGDVGFTLGEGNANQKKNRIQL
jgi:hypothetical protein